MRQIRVEVEGDKVVLDLCSRRTDMLISVDMALRLAAAIEERIPLALAEPPELNRGRPWDLRVESFDGQVGFKFFPPEECAVTRVPLPVRPVNVALKVAELIRFKAEQAEHKMRMVFKPVHPVFAGG